MKPEHEVEKKKTPSKSDSAPNTPKKSNTDKMDIV